VEAWVKLWTIRISMAATCLILVIGMATGIRLPVMLLRSVVVGGVLYVGLRLLGGLVGASLLRLAAEHRMALEEKRAAEAAQTDGVSEAADLPHAEAAEAVPPRRERATEVESPAVEEAAA